MYLRAGLKLINNHFPWVSLKVPYSLSWHITNACNESCLYCDHRFRKQRELSTSEALSLVHDAALLGVKMFMLTGGEPLMRQDMEQLVFSIKKQGLLVAMASNGRLIPDNLPLVKKLTFVKLSLDGDESTHDQIRSPGSFRGVIRAIETLLGLGIKPRLSSVICNLNADKLEKVLEVANHYKLKVKFQPASDIHIKNPPPLVTLEKFKLAYDYLLSHSKKSSSLLVNSQASLQYYYALLSNNKLPMALHCHSTLFSNTITADGYLSLCTPLMEDEDQRIDCKESQGLKRALAMLHHPKSRRPQACRRCWCAHSLELNLLLTSFQNPLRCMRKLFWG
ncbi:MAG: radical SAM protein [Oligoflexia bacterium]|nr:radical SAM protein [Oligoflexia bacterium]MBF0365051.1 radical SAM protein [Oligoflexia bacterium]